ncbi:UNVERIFIED_CONTAM: VAN3-binding protein [Sesamum latifolium]|uniref:VAN3-binding protein n=1 Tax=Sesamum latifolium TaxID=2727402 RepID=A0AAW2SNR1_9LAMI
MELSKALCNTKQADGPPLGADSQTAQADHDNSLLSQNQPLLASESPPMSPRGSDDAKELFLLHQALNPEFISNQQLLRNGIKSGKSRRLELKNACSSCGGVAAAVAALAASSVASPEKSITNIKSSKTSTAIASAAALVASHCIEIAEDMGADHDHILSVVNSAINARTNGDVMTLTAGAATALRGAATLRARLNRENGAGTIVLTDENVWNGKESNISQAVNFVSRGGELLKRTRKGDLHWKQVSFSINSNWQVVAKMKSKHMGGTFTKKKKCTRTNSVTVTSQLGPDERWRTKSRWLTLQ